MSDPTGALFKLRNPNNSYNRINITKTNSVLEVPPNGESKPITQDVVSAIQHYITAFKLEVVALDTPVSTSSSVDSTSTVVANLGNLVNETSTSNQLQAGSEESSPKSTEGDDKGKLDLDKVFTVDELHSQYKADLVSLAEHRKLSTEGNKADLVDRIFAAQSPT